jgi:threonine dehydrogenase-like Zn-dependent dehydrogenase
MQQLTYVRKNTLEWREVPAPELDSPEAALVRPFVAARCDGDPLFLHRDLTWAMNAGVAVHYLDPVVPPLLGSRPFQGPFAVGHEGVAEVLEVGAGVRHLRTGDRVIVPWAISCGHCPQCRLGLTSRCAGHDATLLAAYGFGEAMGGFGGMVSDVLHVPHADAMLMALPRGVTPLAAASASDNIPDGWRCVAPQLQARPGAPVLVAGGSAPSIGLYAAGIAVALGSTQVDYFDWNPERLDIAAALGAHPMEIPRRGKKKWLKCHGPAAGGGYPITVDASADPEGLRFALRSLAPGGVCTSVGYYFQKSTGIPLMQMYANDSTLRTGVSHARAALPEVLALMASGRFDPAPVTTLTADWDDAPEAFLERTTKVVVQRAPRAA